MYKCGLCDVQVEPKVAENLLILGYRNVKYTCPPEGNRKEIIETYGKEITGTIRVCNKCKENKL